MTDELEQSVWVRTAPTPDGKNFMVVVEFDEDRSIRLTKQRAFEYAHAVLTAVQYAEYDSALYGQLRAQMRERGHEESTEALATMVVGFRQGRRQPDFGKFKPFSLEPGVSLFTGKGFLTVLLDGARAGQWSLDAAREHAMAAIESLTVAELDQRYLNLLTETVGLDEDTARETVADLVRFR